MAIQNFVKVSQDHKHIIVKSGGLRGSEGPVGPQGPAGTVAIGTTTTLAPESAATVTNTGTAENAILNFGIPKGSKGDQGIQGIQGPKGDPGAGLIITGSVDTYAELPSDFGPDDAGKAYFVQADGKLYVWSGTQWPADGDGAQFEGPKGDTGATGATGPAGYSPSASVVKVGDTTTITITDEHGTTTANVNDGITPTIDSALSTTSENPVQNKIVTGALNNKQATLQAGDITNTLIADGAITTSKVADGAVTSDKIDSATYSTTEKRVGTWIDGKPVYRRVFIYNTPVTTAENIVIGTVGNVDKLLRLDGVLRFSDGIRYMPVPGVEASSGTTLMRVSAYYFNRSSGEITWYSSDTWGNPYLVTFIEYTKSTD